VFKRSYILGWAVVMALSNLDGALLVRVTKVSEESFSSQIVSMMSRIAEKKPPVDCWLTG